MRRRASAPRPRTCASTGRPGRRASRASCSRPPTSSRRGASADELVGAAAGGVRARVRRGRPRGRQEEEPDALRRPDHRVDGRARGAAGQGAADDRLRDLQPAARTAFRSASTPRSASRPTTGTEPLTQSELALDSPYNTRTTPGPAAGADRQPGPRVASRPRPTRPRPTTSSSSSSPAASGEHAFSETDEQFQQRRRALQRRARRPRRQVAHRLLMAARCSACWAARSPTAARRRCTTPRSRPRPRLALRAAAGPARAVRGDGPRRCRRPATAGANVTIPHKVAALALADDATGRSPRRSVPRTR